MKRYFSQEGLFGEINHFDEGGYAGTSVPNIIDGYDTYDANGNYIGTSQEGLFGETNHYGPDGYMGSSVPGVIGGVYHDFDNASGFSAPNVIDGFDTWIDE